jgi:nucleotide-binding universal stress UspA family protein
MSHEKRILFGVDESDFAKQALAAAGELMRDCEGFKMAIFYGTAEPDFALLPESVGQNPSALETFRKHWKLKAEKILEQARDTLTQSGFDPGRASFALDPNCRNPSYAMLEMAGREGIDTIAVARWGKSSLSQQVMGSVTYRLAQLAHDLAVWIIDPRIRSHDVLVGLVGAPISQRVVEYTVRYFSHLKQSKFTFMHVTPPIPPQYWDASDPSDLERPEVQEKMSLRLRNYNDKVVEIADDAKRRLVEAGIPEQNVILKLQPQKMGIARDILLEMEQGDHGILVIGRKGYKAIKEFPLGSKANKLIVSGRAFVICLVN